MKKNALQMSKVEEVRRRDKVRSWAELRGRGI